MIRVYNLLTDECVSVRNVSGFQQTLTELVWNRLVASDAVSESTGNGAVV